MLTNFINITKNTASYCHRIRCVISSHLDIYKLYHISYYLLFYEKDFSIVYDSSQGYATGLQVLNILFDQMALLNKWITSIKSYIRTPVPYKGIKTYILHELHKRRSVGFYAEMFNLFQD